MPKQPHQAPLNSARMVMSHNNPLVSIVIPAFNAAWCVRRAIDSAVAQSYRHMEVIVVDDGSTDETPRLLDDYENEIVRVIHQSNRGLSGARNTGIREARGEYVAFLDADDWWLPGKLDAQVKLLQDHPETGFCSVATRVEDDNGNPVNLWSCPEWQGSFLETLFYQPAAVAGSGSGVMVRRTLFDKTGMFDEQLRSLEDIDMWMRFAAVSGYACIPEPLAVILKHPDSMSRNIGVMREAAIQVMRKNRNLLPTHLKSSWWRTALAGLLIDYAKWEYREGMSGAALQDTLRALVLSPAGQGRLCLGLLKDMALGRPP